MNKVLGGGSSTRHHRRRDSNNSCIGSKHRGEDGGYATRAGSSHLRAREAAATTEPARRGSSDGNRFNAVEDTCYPVTACQLVDEAVRRKLPGGPAFGTLASPATDDSYDEFEKGPFSGSSLSRSTRLVLAEKALAEVTAQRDEASRKLSASREENATLRAELERARSYQVLYDTAHQEHKDLKASLAASTQICMGQQRLIQMLQQQSQTTSHYGQQQSPSTSPENCPVLMAALDTDELLPPPPSTAQRGANPDAKGGERTAALAAAAIALATQGRGSLGSTSAGGRATRKSRRTGRAGGGNGDARRISRSREDNENDGDEEQGDDGEENADAERLNLQQHQRHQQQSPHGDDVRAPALFPEPDDAGSSSAAINEATAAHSARQAIRAAVVAAAREAASIRDGVSSCNGAAVSGGGASRSVNKAMRGEGNGSSRTNTRGVSRHVLLDDDLISHSSLRREYDDTFLNQPLRGEQRRGEIQHGSEGEGAGSGGRQHDQVGHHAAGKHWAYATAARGGDGIGEGDVGRALDFDVDPGLLAGHVRARVSRSQARERVGHQKPGSQSSVSTVASTTKSTKNHGVKEERATRTARADRAPVRNTNASGRVPPRERSPCRPSAPRQARAVQRLTSGVPASVSSSSVAGGVLASAAAGDTRESRRGSAGSSISRLSTRKRRV